MNATIIRRQKGFGLLEVLISVVILSIGLLGLAALQLGAIRYNHSAYLRSIALTQASSILDRMRANYAGVKAGLYNNLSQTPTSRPSCSVCSSSEIAVLDLYDWNQANNVLLPSGQGTIEGDSTNFVITIRWDNNRTGATGLGCSGDESVDLTCLTVGAEI